LTILAAECRKVWNPAAREVRGMSVQHRVKYVAPKYLRIERTAVQFAEHEVLRAVYVEFCFWMVRARESPGPKYMIM
jgi:hypothetical protein